jgi:SAM-dependent methyltransferase
MKSQDFYNAMADDYHLISKDWESAMERQAKFIDSILKDQSLKILDCSCGIGTQAIGLALMGYDVTACDISQREIQIARENCKRLKVTMNFFTGDMRELPHDFSNKFDAVISFDNAVAHLLTDGDFSKALRSMRSCLKEDGRLLFSVRDYDLIRKNKPSGTTPFRVKDQHGERIYFQTWKWAEDGKSYDMDLFILKNQMKQWSASPISTRMRAYTSEEIQTLISKEPFTHTIRLEPSECGYYQPVYVLTP